MSGFGDYYENTVTGELAVILQTPTDDPTASAIVHLTVKPGGAVAGEHVHPTTTERFRVVSGKLGVRLHGAESTLEAGQEATAPAGVPHDWWNAGDTEASVIVEVSPGDERFEHMIATVFGLANAGKSDKKGMPKPLQLSLIAVEFSDVIRFTKPPAVVQKVAFGILGAIARRRGLRGVYPEYLHPHGTTTPDPAVVEFAGVTPPAATTTQATKTG